MTRRRELPMCVRHAAGPYLAGTLAVFVGAAFGHLFVPLSKAHPSASRSDLLSGFATWDGQWYARIVNEGYSYDPGKESSVAFFPAYPLLAKLVSRATRMPAPAALLLVSHASLVAAMALLTIYVRQRFAEQPRELSALVALAIGIFPTTFYFRMAYSESMFLCLAVLAMLGMARRWSPALVAAIVGLATGTRSVGVALLVPFGMYLWQREFGRGPQQLAEDEMHGGKRNEFRSTFWHFSRFFASATFLAALACWGLIGYIAYLSEEFDAPLAFIDAQRHWYQTVIHHDHLAGRLARLLTFAPARDVYDSTSRCYWGLHPPNAPAFSMLFANPVYFGLTLGAVLLGATRRWLDVREVALSLALLLIPYVLRADDTCMASQARFASAVFPAYIVVGRLLLPLGPAAVAAFAAFCAALLCVYSALFVSWYWFW